ncbi:acyl-CoA dehydrogenase family protein [Hirschia baltica]|uniref:Acyl-CoA dehydrogenase domain protein n=1 Tax=Hirschia baltica (strain ATCC 49814 / DSM 5838 / IFAM 1418) TaxID=582402 RepID=C6XQY2_HIRBI|nr:acyl-CoA dehydrogenase family protein [Hirschia baltica]ACT60513.1 acyl-CoA dehydrogenase domain protein [Hirschia baltica ATCC 49814]
MTSMDLGPSEKVKPLIAAVREIVREKVLPLEVEFHNEVGKAEGGRFAHTERQKEILDEIKKEPKERGLWNFWLTGSDRGYGLSTVEYAYLAEEMGWSPQLGAEAFNCSAPDTGNMEVLERYGNEEQKNAWLSDLLQGNIRSAYLMTEPDVASSDATALQFEAKLDGDEWVLNGEKHWASGAGDPRCRVYILMAKTEDDSAGRHGRHSMFAISSDHEGIEIIRPMQVFGHDDAPHGHMHIRFTNVRVPKDALLLGRGRGFEVSQGRLGPGRIHHCMRAIGQAERALELLCKRATSREAFGRPLHKLGANYDIIAEARISIEQARLLCLKAAWMMDQGDAKAAGIWISQIKVQAPRMALKVIDEAMQMHGGLGISQDTPLAEMYTGVRTLRFADGPDAVHRMVIARDELKKYTNR